MNLDLKQDNISICDHPIALHNLSVMRNKDTNSELFRNASKRLAEVLFFSATDNLPMIEVETETPLTKTKTKIIDPNAKIIIAPILRAALLFSEIAVNLIPQAIIQHIGMYRDKESLKPVWYYNKLPQKFQDIENTYVYILDPMLATGGSAVEAIKLYLEKGIPEERIRFISLLSAPVGVETIHKHFKNVKVITTWVDEGLNDHGYIMPGLGDAGDRIFNTFYLS